MWLSYLVKVNQCREFYSFIVLNVGIGRMFNLTRITDFKNPPCLQPRLPEQSLQSSTQAVTKHIENANIYILNYSGGDDSWLVRLIHNPKSCIPHKKQLWLTYKYSSRGESTRRGVNMIQGGASDERLTSALNRPSASFLPRCP